MIPACVDLHALCGERYKIRKEAAGLTWTETPEAERAWLLEIPCKHGLVYPQGGDVLAATITSRRIGHQVAALSCIRSSRGDVERVVTFHVDDAEAVLAIMKPRPVYRMTEARRRHLDDARAKSSLRLGRQGAGARQGEVETGARIDAALENDLGHVPEAPDAGNLPGDVPIAVEEPAA